MYNKIVKFIYDLEIYPNYLLAGFKNLKSGKISIFKAWYADNKANSLQIADLKTFLKNEDKSFFIGFNNVNFDGPLLEFIYKNEVNNTQSFLTELYTYSQNLIKNRQKHQTQFYQIDCRLINHFDNEKIGRTPSLKHLEFSMQMNKVQSLPFEPGTILTEEQMAIVENYWYNDIEATEKLYEYTVPLIKANFAAVCKYRDWSLMNANGPHLGEEIFTKELVNLNPGVNLNGTKRSELHLGELIFDYIKFNSNEFNSIKNFISDKVIRSTKGVFTLLEFEELDKYGIKYHKQVKKGRQKNLNTIFAGIPFVFGLGGIHASVSNKRVYADEEYIILDLDVASYYPNLAIKNNLYPAHLGKDFITIYNHLFEQRKVFPKGTSENLFYKLALNGSYGKSNSPYSPLYDPKFTMSITINGQLLLALLAERLHEISEIIQVNTDGLTVRIKRTLVDKAMKIAEDWQKLTKLTLEEAVYSKMYIRDVNNYYAQYNNGKEKEIGAYLRSADPRNLHKDYSNLSAPIGAIMCMSEGITPEEALNKIKIENKRAFLKLAKVKKNLDHKLFHGETEIDSTSVYYVSNLGYELVKQMPPLAGETNLRHVSLEAGYVTQLVSVFKNQELDINEEYYINEMKKLIL